MDMFYVRASTVRLTFSHCELSRAMYLAGSCHSVELMCYLYEAVHSGAHGPKMYLCCTKLSLSLIPILCQ